ncbi:alpha-mannosidase [Leptolyngbya sp. FACHB-671]|uniref:alpha-mannosidase n=1 Tax=Leptolyngbya sp. FACHB-671 TaxID=2692812 RepID=UPI001F557F9B|nr:alpha-mannosidase [Leptolyngbya sp. FACHB-671]
MTDVTSVAQNQMPQNAVLTVMEQSDQAIAHLRQLTQLDIQANWHYYLEDLSIAEANQPERWKEWAIASLNARQHVAWAKGQQVLWLGQTLTIPPALEGYFLEGLALRLAVVWWAEDAQIFVNGKLVQEGDIFDASTRILLSPFAKLGEQIHVALRLVSPSHDDGALVKSLCLYENSFPDSPTPEPGFVADELAVLQRYLTAFAPEKLERLATAIAQLDWAALRDQSTASRLRFDQSLQALRQELQPLGDRLKQRQVQLVGHAHLDLAWLWTVSDTWEAAERTFKSVLSLQQDFPELTFCHSSPALFAWVEQHRPELFAAIQAQVAAGTWEIAAGLWVEPELNLVNGESIVRQVLYGQRYVQEKFGKLSAIAWLPDSFGFCWQLPQILKQGGIEYFVTQKLRWNDTTEFPHELFWWRSPDGSEILSFMSPRIGEGIDPLKISEYASTWEAKTTVQQSLWLPGVGDHGGGPTRDMLEVGHRWQHSPFFPQLTFSTVLDYLRSLPQMGNAHPPSLVPSPHQPPIPSLPTLNSELYLEFHRGCYTSHADQKWWNRRCERLLYQAELFSSVATLLTGASYPKAAIESAWKQVLFNQFHDILPGSSIAEVFDDANQAWIKAEQIGEELLVKALEAIATQIHLPAPLQPDCQPIVVFNSLNWARSEVVAVPVSEANLEWRVFNLEGCELSCQMQRDHDAHLLFHAESIPGLGYQVYWLKGDRPTGETASHPSQILAESSAPSEAWVLENKTLRVSIDPETGNLSSVFDKVQQRQVLSNAGNQLQFFKDSGQYWDAWNIDPDYTKHALPAATLKQICWLERGEIQQRLRVVRQFGQSEFQQDYILQRGLPVLKIATVVNWQESQVLVKAAFPLNLKADFATYEIPCGAIARPTLPPNDQTHDQADTASLPDAVRAKWEVPALQWADLSQSDEGIHYGVSLLNDCKHGYDSQPSQFRLTLLRSSEWPHAAADRGIHQFCYALYPHSGDWQSAETVHRGYELNQPLLVVRPKQEGNRKLLPPTGQFLQLESQNLVLTAFKQSEQGDRWVLRVYECEGRSAELKLADLGDLLSEYLDPETAQITTLLEESDGSSLNQETRAFHISPWRIATFTFKRQRDQ